MLVLLQTADSPLHNVSIMTCIEMERWKWTYCVPYSCLIQGQEVFVLGHSESSSCTTLANDV
jgi:hypothetical protein